ncbi:unnamed protein product [Miscanthus lutarioriparius]|uniref:Uncharacterized protein n=1 Tax=Miscanthus lutarioriparius TaxID=422564 RepID=A0A811NR27_9POAL|nr:unnamed protein product [Miscanthus lutarioriparius]
MAKPLAVTASTSLLTAFSRGRLGAAAAAAAPCPRAAGSVTAFASGGFVVGFRFSHAVADGPGSAQFMNAVGELARGAERVSVEPRRDPGPGGRPWGSPAEEDRVAAAPARRITRRCLPARALVDGGARTRVGLSREELGGGDTDAWLAYSTRPGAGAGSRGHGLGGWGGAGPCEVQHGRTCELDAVGGFGGSSALAGPRTRGLPARRGRGRAATAGGGARLCEGRHGRTCELDTMGKKTGEDESGER